MQVLDTFLYDSDLHMIRLLLADTTLEPQLAKGNCAAFTPLLALPKETACHLRMLFVVYLEAALHDLRQMLPQHPLIHTDLPLDIVYTHDMDFVSYICVFLNQVEKIVPTSLRPREVWRKTKKLGSYWEMQKMWLTGNSWLC